MMYDELVKRLREYGKEHCPLDRGSGICGCIDAREAADAIEELSMKLHGDEAAIAGMKREIESMVRAEKPRWIPVTERLPEKNEMVIAYTPVDGYMFVGFHFSYKWGSNTVSKWRIVTAMRSTKDITKKVTHWMPLPQPPKEET